VIVVLPSCRRELEVRAFKKTTRATPQRNITVAQRRLHEVIA
jgi:phage-related protein